MNSNTYTDIDSLVDRRARQAAARRLSDGLSRQSIRKSRGLHLAIMSVMIIVIGVVLTVSLFAPDDGYTMTTNGQLGRAHFATLPHTILAHQ